MTPRERGSAAIWVVACCALLTVVASVVTVRGLAVLARHRAEASADLAALAAAGQIGVSGDSCATATRIAADNGTRLRTCVVWLAPDGRSGTVTVRVALTLRLPVVGGAEVAASARAARLATSPGHAAGPVADADAGTRDSRGQFHSDRGSRAGLLHRGAAQDAAHAGLASLRCRPEVGVRTVGVGAGTAGDRTGEVAQMCDQGIRSGVTCPTSSRRRTVLPVASVDTNT